MKWSDIRKRIRRFLRDPDSNIWSDSYLLRLFNIAQSNFFMQYGLNDRIESVRTPPTYQASCTYDWEWQYTGHTKGEVYKFGYDHDPSMLTCSFRWEIEQLASNSETVSSLGYAYTHPWEAFLVDGDTPPPLRTPKQFHEIKYACFDYNTLTATNERLLMSLDFSYRTRKGAPVNYYRNNDLENQIFLYPTPSSVQWEDITSVDDIEMGTVLFDGSGTINQEDGVVTDITGGFDNMTDGGAIDYVNVDNQFLVIASCFPTDITNDDDQSEYPVWVLKYLEHEVLEMACEANTQGRIKSLADYWRQRKEVVGQVMALYRIKKNADRKIRFTGGDKFQPSKAGRPILPDGYPLI